MSLLSRYVVGQYLRYFAACLVAATALFLVADFFLRIEDFAEHDASSASVASFFLWKLPRILQQVYPAAALLGVLLGIGLMTDRREIVAMHACGASTRQIATPLLLTAAIISAGAFAWNEVVVPPTASRARTVKDIQIKRLQREGHLDARSLWFQGSAGFFNIDYFDAGRNILYGLTLHTLDDSFRMQRLVEIPKAVWSGTAWEPFGGTVTDFAEGSEGLPRALRPGDVRISDTPVEFRKKRRRSYEFDFAQLRDQIEILSSKGLDANEYLVDLHFKIALPFSGLIAVLIGFPLATRASRRSGLAYNMSVAMVVVFAYWAVMAVSVSAGHAGNLPPIVAAWAANVLFSAIPAYFYLTAHR